MGLSLFVWCMSLGSVAIRPGSGSETILMYEPSEFWFFLGSEALQGALLAALRKRGLDLATGFWQSLTAWRALRGNQHEVRTTAKVDSADFH